MNHIAIRNYLGKILILIALLMLFPLLISIIYLEGWRNAFAFIIPIVLLLLFGFLMNIKKPETNKLMPREGFIIVGLAWLLMSLFGCLPFIISKNIPNFFDAFFEITSGFTTTGSSITGDYIMVEDLDKSILFWRSFSHWIGGMGILVFILAVIPESKEGSSMHVLRAESPGPQVGKLVSRMSATSRILYLIYMGITVIMLLFMVLGPNHEVSFFDSLLYTFGTAGTGGLSLLSTGLETLSPYYQYVIGTFMIIFGVNFSIYYLILIGKVKEVLKNEELYWFLGIVFTAVVIVFFSILKQYNYNIEQTFRLSFFQVASIISTTGYTTVNYDTWPSLAQGVLLILMLCGASAGSTAGGIKVSRIIILIKSSIRKIKKMINPRKVEALYVSGKTVDNDTIEGTQSFIIVFFFVLILCAFLISIDSLLGINDIPIFDNITASIACISNIGPGFFRVGPHGTYAEYSSFSKIVLSLEMICGRLELFPILIIFNPKTWKKNIR